jgi:hypothetical protein
VTRLVTRTAESRAAGGPRPRVAPRVSLSPSALAGARGGGSLSSLGCVSALYFASQTFSSFARSRTSQRLNMLTVTKCAPNGGEAERAFDGLEFSGKESSAMLLRDVARHARTSSARIQAQARRGHGMLLDGNCVSAVVEHRPPARHRVDEDEGAVEQ